MEVGNEMWELMRLVPKNHLSWVVGQLAQIERPQFLVRHFVRLFAEKLRLDESESEFPFSHYPSVQKLFTRRLKPRIRPVYGDLVSPVDAELREHGALVEDKLILVKGTEYRLEHLCGRNDELVAKIRGGYFYNFYLSPQDYHHVHAPCGMDIVAVNYIPGRLWPVNNWAIKNIQDLFSVNERVVIFFNYEFGCGALVMVGACNVGRMSLAFDSLKTNSFNRSGEMIYKSYSPPIATSITDLLGTFNLGSSVVLLLSPFSKQQQVENNLAKNLKIRIGQTLK